MLLHHDRRSTLENPMKPIPLIVGLTLCVTSTQAQESNPVAVKQMISTSVNSSGQAINLPQGNAQVVVSTYDIAAGATLPEHKHPFPRYGYVLAGKLRVTNTDTMTDQEYKPGDFILEAVGQWHKATAVGVEPVKLLIIDMVEQGKANVILKK
jgi:quercetin dioxygenase-like cupin family protein